MHDGESVRKGRAGGACDVAYQALPFHRSNGVDLHWLVIDEDKRGILGGKQCIIDGVPAWFAGHVSSSKWAVLSREKSMRVH